MPQEDTIEKITEGLTKFARFALKAGRVTMETITKISDTGSEALKDLEKKHDEKYKPKQEDCDKAEDTDKES